VTVGFRCRYPYAVPLYPFPGCGGSLIHPRVILTAAHCGNSTLDYPENVTVGIWNYVTPDAGDTYDTIDVAGYRNHPDWSGSIGTPDFALILLATASTMTPVRLSQSANDAPAGATAHVVGWGRVDDALADKVSDVLKEASTTISTESVCTDTYGANSTIDICVTDINGGSCNGDSGGPLIIKDAGGDAAKDLQIGIVSYGPKVCLNNPGMYSRVSYAYAWIEETMQGWNLSLQEDASAAPSAPPSDRPSEGPSASPSALPSAKPSEGPSASPSGGSASPSAAPSGGPSASPSVSQHPSAHPSDAPSALPSARPSEGPSASPSALPSARPSAHPSAGPSLPPTLSQGPSTSPSMLPSASPSASVPPSMSPSFFPSARPSLSPSAVPSASPSMSPSAMPSKSPSQSPSLSPSQSPSTTPSQSPSVSPSMSPSTVPTTSPSAQPSQSPSTLLTPKPTTRPSSPPTKSLVTSPPTRMPTRTVSVEVTSILSLLIGPPPLVNGDQVCAFLEEMVASMELDYSRFGTPTIVQLTSLNGEPIPCSGRRGNSQRGSSRRLQEDVTAMDVGVTVRQTVESSDPTADVEEEMRQNLAADLTVAGVGAALDVMGIPVRCDSTTTDLNDGTPPIVDEGTVAPTAAPTRKSGKKGKQGKDAKTSKSGKKTKSGNESKSGKNVKTAKRNF